MTQPRIVHCPRCGAAVVWGPQSAFRPFCSERCRKIDLGAWADGSYRIDGNATAEDLTVVEQAPATPHE